MPSSAKDNPSDHAKLDTRQPIATKHAGPSHSDIESDGDSADERPSVEILREGLEVLHDDYESDVETPPQSKARSGLWTGWFSRRSKQGEYTQPPDMHRRQTRVSRRHRERRKRGQTEEEAEMMYEMEEGGEASLSVSRTSSDMDLKQWSEKDAAKTRKNKRKAWLSALIYLAIILFFMVMIYGAYSATRATRRGRKSMQLVSNGTSLWAPTTLVISLDGFRADFLQRGLSPTLNAFIREGISPLYMLPPFPSVTFVSHYCMSTGMYAEEHGIVGNTFWDPELNEEFYYTRSESSMQSKWWGGEPFWVTAENQGLKTAIHMWPGSEAHIDGVDLDFVDTYNGAEKLGNKVNRVLGWLDLPGPESPDKIAESPRPQLIVAYVPNVDTDGHLYGPNSTEIRQTIQDADGMLTGIFDGIKARNLTDIVNVIVVSDHGMATTSVDRLIQLDDLVDVNKIEHMDGWPLYGLRPKKDEDIEIMYDEIKAKSELNANFNVYLRDKNMPPEYHFSKNPRIAPLWIVPQTGWAIVEKKELDVVKAKEEGLEYNPKGLHGYDYRDPLMRAIFVARGPAFPHQPHSRVEAFQNIEVYNIICDSLGIKPSANSGSLRLPFKPIGLHSDEHAPQLETPEDPPPRQSSSPSSTNTSATTPLPTGPLPTKLAGDSLPGDADDDVGYTTTLRSIWKWFGDTLSDIKDRISGLFGGSRNDDDDDD